MAKHNKKRNVGLIHEQLVRYISECIVNQDQKSANIAIDILENHFHKDSELYREFRLFNSLVYTRVSSRDLAKRILGESKSACRNHDSTKLMKEKSALIKDINYLINKDGFYDSRISEYKTFATVQALLNEWRGKGKLFPEEKVKYEIVLENWLARDNSGPTIRENAEANPLVLNLMIEKFNKKYGSHLNKMQKDLITAKLSRDKELVEVKISEIKSRGLQALSEFYKSCDNKFLLSKKDKVDKKINEMVVGSDDISIEKALSLATLIEELENNDE